MDWQEGAVFALVALAAGALLWRHFRRRRRLFASGCDHCSGAGSGAGPNLIFRARKNGPRTVEWRARGGRLQ